MIGDLPRERERYIYRCVGGDDPEYVRCEPNSCMADRDTRYLPFPGEKASRHSSVEHSIPHVISRVPARVCVNLSLSPGYHICSVTHPSSAPRPDHWFTLFLRLSIPLSPRSQPLRPSPSPLARPSRRPPSIPFESRCRPLSLSRSPRAICL